MKINFFKKALNQPNEIIPYLRNKISPLSASNPNDFKATYSDIFIWRSKKNWQTSYDWIPLIDLIDVKVDLKNNIKRKSRLLIFSKKGILLSEINLQFEGHKKFEVNISEYISSIQTKDNYGTFTIFHNDIPSENLLEEGNLSDRGYVSYGFNGGIIKSYVHGNLDAVSSDFSSNGINKFSYFKSTILKRRFNLQYLFKSFNNYELGLTNPTKKKQIVIFEFLNNKAQKFKSIRKEINSLGAELIRMPKYKKDYLVSIRSNLPIARPLIFKFNGKNFVDVFHG